MSSHKTQVGFLNAIFFLLPIFITYIFIPIIHFFLKIGTTTIFLLEHSHCSYFPVFAS